MLKQVAVWVIAALAVGLLLLAASSIRASVPSQEYQACIQNQKERPAEKIECKASETLWERSLRDPVAFYTLGLTIFTAALAAVGISQVIAVSGQLKLTREEFRASHRPEIIVRNMHMSSDSVVFIYYNLGRDDARNIEIEAAVYASEIGKISSNRNLLSCELTKTTLASGSFGITTAVYTVGDAFGIGFAEEISNAVAARLDKKRTATHCVGMVRYEDSRGLKRQMGFARYHDPDTGRFNVVDDEEYEYSY